MFDLESWAVVEDAEDRAYVLSHHGIPKELAAAAPALTIAGQALDFYDDAAVAVLIPEGGKAREFLLANRQALEMDGDPQTILLANLMVGLKLTEENVLSYFRFFWTMVRGDKYPRMLEPDQMDHPDGELSAAVRPATFLETVNDTFVCDGTMMQDKRLERMLFAVDRRGAMKLLDRWHLGEFQTPTVH